MHRLFKSHWFRCAVPAAGLLTVAVVATSYMAAGHDRRPHRDGEPSIAAVASAARTGTAEPWLPEADTAAYFAFLEFGRDPGPVGSTKAAARVAAAHAQP